MNPERFDAVIVGGTPGGIMAAIALARRGHASVILERTSHIGGLPANGLGATDIATRGATGGLFRNFVDRVRDYYAKAYGDDSEQVKTCSDGYHFEPSVGERVLLGMLSEHKQIAVRLDRQFDAVADHVVMRDRAPTEVTVLNRQTGAWESYAGMVFIDATYEGDLAAGCGCKFETRREGRREHNEIGAGKTYKRWGGDECDGTTGEGDDVIQAFNYRLCLTDRTDNQIAIEKPATYNRDDFVSLIDDVKSDRRTGTVRRELEADGIGRIVNMVRLPNGKTDSNNQHLAFLSTDLPVENYPWPTADWAWRDRFARRLRDYTLGLLWFAQNDEALPEEFRQNCRRWGLANDEYTDNDHFPRQVYVREGRRIAGEHLFTANDARPAGEGLRPPVYESSVTASHYALDSHAVLKREPNRCHLDGFLSYPTEPYTVPYGAIVPKDAENLLIPVPVSGTHIGFSTLRMEPCWMALGEAAGVAAAFAIESKTLVRRVDLARLQRALLEAGAVLIYFRDVAGDHPAAKAAQYCALRGAIPQWLARLDEPADDDTFQAWTQKFKVDLKPASDESRGELLRRIYDGLPA